MDCRLLRSRLTACVVTLALVAGCSEQTTQPARSAAPRTAYAKASVATARYLVLSSGSGFSADFASAVAALGGVVESVHQGAGVAVVRGLTAAAAAQLAASTGIADVEADAVVTLHAPIAAVQADASAISNPGARSTLNPTLASRYSWQWNMRAIHADAAWAAGKLGDPGVTVAIMDTGIDYDAPDLAGLVDLSRSTSFIPSDDSIRSKYFPTRNNISDFNGHGTNVATQVSSNAVALAGVTSRTTLIGVKVLGADGSGSFSAIIDGILYAADHGADVANMSLGADFLKAGNGRLTSVLNRVFNYANAHGMLIVVAAGNDGADLDQNGNDTDAFCDMVHVVCVAATGPALATGPVDTPAYYSNFGRSAISVAAPGGNGDAADGFPLSAWPWGNDIASWVWSYCSKTLIASFDRKGNPVLTSCATGHFLTGFIGTSQATPHVAGLAALLVAGHGHNQPAQIKSLIQQSADDLGQPGTDPFYGHGRIDVGNAVRF